MAESIAKSFESEPPKPKMCVVNEGDRSWRLSCASITPKGATIIVVVFLLIALLFGGGMYYIFRNFWVGVYFLGFMLFLIGMRYRVVLKQDTVLIAWTIFRLLPFRRTKSALWEHVTSISDRGEGVAIETAGTTLWVRSNHAEHRNWVISTIGRYLQMRGK